MVAIKLIVELYVIGDIKPVDTAFTCSKWDLLGHKRNQGEAKIYSQNVEWHTKTHCNFISWVTHSEIRQIDIRSCSGAIKGRTRAVGIDIHSEIMNWWFRAAKLQINLYDGKLTGQTNEKSLSSPPIKTQHNQFHQWTSLTFCPLIFCREHCRCVAAVGSWYSDPAYCASSCNWSI